MEPTQPTTSATISRIEGGPHFVVPPETSTAPPLRAAQARIEEILVTSEQRDEAILRLLSLAVQLTNASTARYVKNAIHGGGSLQADASRVFSQETYDQVERWAEQTTVDEVVRLDRLESFPETIISLPVFSSGRVLDVLQVALLVRTNAVEPLVVSLQLVATAISAWDAKHLAGKTEFEARVASACVELVAKLNNVETVDESYLTLVTELQKFLGCTAVAVAVADSQERLRVAAFSGSSGIDEKSRFVCDLVDAAVEACSRGTLTAWPPLSTSDQHATRVHQHVVQQHGYEALLSVPMVHQDQTVGVLMVMGTSAVMHDSQTIGILRAMASPLAGALASRKAATAGPLARWWGNRTARKRGKYRAMLIGAALSIACMLLPVPHKITCDCHVEPVIKRFATVPFDGLLKDSFVKPGDHVAVDQVLAKMDDRDLQFERSEATAARVQALKEADVHLSKGKVAEAQIAQLKAAEWSAKLDWIAYQEEHLEIKSQMDGVVVAGDLEHAQGAPVRMGQVLFEVAPLESMKLKVEIPEGDIFYCEETMQVSARLDGVPGDRFTGRLERITPRAQAVSGQNAYEADAALEATGDAVLRPGMSGTVKLIGPRRALGWIVFHRAYRAVWDFLVW